MVEVEEVGRVIYSVRSLSSANHQSSIINHPVQNSSWFKISGQGFLVPTRGQSSRLPPQAFSPASGSLISIESLVGSEVETRRKTLVLGLAASLRFHWVKDVSEQPID
jgi:hypothetical protein